MSLGTSRNLREVQCTPFNLGELEHEVRREPGRVAAYLFVQPLCEYAVKPRKIRIQHHPLAANLNNRRTDRFDIRQRFHLQDSPCTEARNRAEFLPTIYRKAHRSFAPV